MALNSIIAIVVFVVIYFLISLEVINRAVLVISGSLMLLFLGVINDYEILGFIDFETIGLLFGMMILVNVLKHCGFITYLTLEISKYTKGEPSSIMICSFLISAIFSAFLDNITTVLIMVPLTIEFCKALGFDPRKYIVGIIIAANIGGAATLIGGPPNILIGSANNFTFDTFLKEVAPAVLMILILVLYYLLSIYRRSLPNIAKNLTKQYLVELSIYKIKSKHRLSNKYLSRGIIILMFVLALFITQPLHSIKSSVISILGATLALLYIKTEPIKIFKEVEWDSLLFFIFLFVMVGALEKTGVIKYIVTIIQGKAFLIGSKTLLILVILWGVGLLSAFLDNIPLTIAMIPIIREIVSTTGFTDLWWALSLGACLGGIGTLIGSSANIVASDICKKHGYTISFFKYALRSMAILIISLSISSIYLIIK